jgi:diguanylate cyclase (GGDEF)-like protein
MGAQVGRHHTVGVASATLLLAAALVRVLTLPLAAPLLAAEVLLAGLLLLFVLTATWFSREGWSHRGPLLVLYALALSLLGALALLIAAPVLPHYSMFAALTFAAILLSIDVDAPRPAVVAAGAMVIFVFVELWLSTVPVNQAEVASLVIACGLLAGLELVVLAHAARLRRRVDEDAMHGRVLATFARNMGVERDLTSVAAAVLTAARETFPATTFGAVLLADPTDGLLKAPGVVLGRDGISSTGPMLELAPGEWLGGASIAADGARIWPTALEVAAAEATLRDPNRLRLRDSHLGFTRSAIAAPLHPPASPVIGCLVLTSHRRESVWAEQDLQLMRTFASEAARAIERARRHEADVDQALLDSITGLVSHRRLISVVDKEVARAARAGDSVAIIFSDLDDFKEINDRLGHDAGNHTLVMFADVLRAALRREDTAARYGGDEFVCVLPGADREQARAVAERIRQHFAESAREDAVIGSSKVSASYGVAVYPEDAATADEILAAADVQLLRAKQSRDQIVVGRARGAVEDGADALTSRLE